MKQGDDIIVQTAAMAITGEATAAVAGRTLLVPGGLPGERIHVRVALDKGSDLVAEIVKVENASPQRVTPGCRHAAECGGCGWQHIAYPEQLRLKQRALQDLLSRSLGKRAPAVRLTIGMPVGADGMPWGFRQKAAFVFDAAPHGEGLVMGHFARSSNRVVPVTECPVHGERANRIAFSMRDALRRAKIPAAAERNGLLRHVVIRTTQDEKEAAAVLVVTKSHPSLRAPLGRLLASGARPDGLMLNLHDRPGPYMLGRETLRVDGPGHVREEALGASFLVSPTGFFQTNVAAAAELLRLVTEAMPKPTGARVLDLYSGSGLFALPLAKRGHSVTAVEESRKASKDAGLNGRANAIPRDRLRLVCSKVEAALPWLLRERYDAAVLDPPRQGCPPKVLRELARELAPSRIVLVSCNPEALAREIPILLDAGYHADLVQPVDMFPHTPHIETVAVFSKRAPSGERERGRAPAPARGRTRTQPAGGPRHGRRSARR